MILFRHFDTSFVVCLSVPNRVYKTVLISIISYSCGKYKEAELVKKYLIEFPIP